MTSLYRIILTIIIFFITFLISFTTISYFKPQLYNYLVINRIQQDINNTYTNFQQNVWGKVGDKIVLNSDQNVKNNFKQYFDIIFNNIVFENIQTLDLYGNIINSSNSNNIIANKLLGEEKILYFTFSNMINEEVLTIENYKNFDLDTNYQILKSNDKFYLQSILKLKNSDNKINGLLLLWYNITESFIFFHQFCLLIVSVLSIIFALIVANIIVYYIKLQKILEDQIQTNAELEKEKEKAENLSNQKSQFLANMSHELRTPLNAIIGFSEIIKSEALGKVEIAQYKEYASDINNSGTHLLALINDILDFSKADADKLVIDYIQVDATKMIKQCLRTMQAKADEAKVLLIDEVSNENHFTIMADPKRLKQVILNILSNSVKFTGEGGKIRTDIQIKDEQNINLIFRDTGVGIEAKNIAKVLSPFEQVDNKHSRKHDGTGLGLPLSKKLVELMNGSFNIESEIGIGTTIILSFKRV